MIDLTDHSPAASARPHRKMTTAIVVHRFAVDLDKDGAFSFTDAIRFFTQDPEGLLTILDARPYAAKLADIKRWREHGVPTTYQGRGFVPYHVLVDADGEVAQTLDLDAIGAHAGGWNSKSVAVSVMWRCDLRAPPPELCAGAARAIAHVLRRYPTAEVIDHDETLRRAGKTPKGCVGAFFPMAEVVRSARALIAPS